MSNPEVTPETTPLERTLARQDPIVLDVAGAGEDRRGGFVERLAEFGLWSAFRPTPRAVPAPRPKREPLQPSGPWHKARDGECLDRGSLRRVSVWRDAASLRRLEYDDGETYVVAADGRAIARSVAPGGAAPSRPLLERVFGGALALALAIREIHLLHASAIARGTDVVALTASSGVGKSTLAAGAGKRATTWARVADDILPVRLTPEALALPHFPQLKLPEGGCYPAGAPSRRRLVAVVALERRDHTGAVELHRLDPAESALTLLGATVAARLFDDHLLARHLASCAAAAESICVARLCYPSGLDRIDDLLSLLERELF